MSLEAAESPQRAEKASAEKTLILRYKRLFSRDDGKAVWDDLCGRFGFDRSLMGDDLAMSGEVVARREAMRQPLYYIRAMRDHVFPKEPRGKLRATMEDDLP